MPRLTAPCVVVLVAALLLPTSAAAQETLSDEEVQRRIEFIEPRLDAAVTPMKRWYWGVAGFYAFGFTIQLTRTLLEKGRARRVALIYSTTKATLGMLGQGLRYPDTLAGAEALRAMPNGTEAERRAKLEKAEELLHRYAHEAERPYGYLPHLMNHVLNAFGAVLVGVGYNRPDIGVRNALLSTVIGEFLIWTQPNHAEQALEAYEREFGLKEAPAVELSVAAGAGSISLRLDF